MASSKLKQRVIIFILITLLLMSFIVSTAERCSDTLEIVSGRADYTRLKGLKEFNFWSNGRKARVFTSES